MKKDIVKQLILFTALIVSYLLFMMLGTLMPDAKVRRNIERSVCSLERQGNYPRAVFDSDCCQMDNFTDGLILNIAYHISADSMRTSMFAVPYANVGMDMSIGLKKMVAEQVPGTIHYTRYWHGSTFLMRFFLLLGNFEYVRQLLFVLSMALLLVTFSFVQNEIGIPCALAYFSGFFFLYGFIMQMSMQFFPILMIVLGTSLALSLHWRDFSRVILVFIAAGSLTSFFDLLTTPLLSVGLPILLYMLFSRDENLTWLEMLWRMVRCAFAWGVSFAATWATKWALGSLMLGENIFKDAFNQIAYRSEICEDFNRWDAVSANLHMMNYPLMMWFLLALCLLCVFFFNKRWLRSGSLCILLVVVPYIWYYIVSNHSYIHWWFTYRLQMLSVTAVFVTVAGFVDWHRAADWMQKLKAKMVQWHK